MFPEGGITDGPGFVRNGHKLTYKCTVQMSCKRQDYVSCQYEAVILLIFAVLR